MSVGSRPQIGHGNSFPLWKRVGRGLLHLSGESRKTAYRQPGPGRQRDRLILVGLVLIYAFSKDSERMKFAHQIIQTIVNFAIGVVAGILGTGAA